MSAARPKKRRVNTPKDASASATASNEHPLLWAFDNATLRECTAFEQALHALLRETYRDVAGDSELQDSSDLRYRASARSALADAIIGNQRENAHSQDVWSEQKCREKALAIEENIYQRFFMTDIGSYAESLRALVYNLRINGYRALRQHTVDALCSLPFQDLAVGTDVHAWRTEREAALLGERHALQNANGDAQVDSIVPSAKAAAGIAVGKQCAAAGDEEEGEEGIFRCPKCHGHNTSYVSMQTRSADEPMTNFVTCHTCDIRFRR